MVKIKDENLFGQYYLEEGSKEKLLINIESNPKEEFTFEFLGQLTKGVVIATCLVTLVLQILATKSL